jgi:hypothetical protein
MVSPAPTITGIVVSMHQINYRRGALKNQVQDFWEAILLNTSLSHREVLVLKTRPNMKSRPTGFTQEVFAAKADIIVRSGRRVEKVARPATKDRH